MCPLCGCPAMFTLLLLSCFGAAAAGSPWASPLAGGCGREDCNPSASQSVLHHTSPTLPAATEWAALNHRSDNTVSTLPFGSTDPARMLNSHSLLRGDASTASHHQTPSTYDVFGGQHLSEKLETHFPRKGAEKRRSKDVSEEAASMSSDYSQRSNRGRPLSKDVLPNTLYAVGTLDEHHWSERLGYTTDPKLKKEAPAHLSSIFTHKSSQPYNLQSGARLHMRSWKDYNSHASTREAAKMVQGQGWTLPTIDDDVVNLGHSAAPKEEHVDVKMARKSGIARKRANVLSVEPPSPSPLQSYRSSAEGHLARDYHPSGSPDIRERVGFEVTASAKPDDDDSAMVQSTSANKVPADDDEAAVIQTPDPDLQEQEEELEEAIAKDATLIVVFSCLAVASLLIWRIVRCIAMHKLKKHEKNLEVAKASSV